MDDYIHNSRISGAKVVQGIYWIITDILTRPDHRHRDYPI